MKALADELEKMDKYFSTKKESEKWLIIGLLAGLITLIAYSYLLPYSEKLFKSSEVEKKRLSKSIATENSYLRSITVGGDRDYYIKDYDKKILNKKNQIVTISNKIAYINSSLEKLSGMLFNEKSWANFLNSITKNAQSHNVKINFIKNKYLENKGSFGHILEVEVGGVGDFKGIIQFLNEMEQNILVTDVYNIHLEGNEEGINADINISVWGINH